MVDIVAGSLDLGLPPLIAPPAKSGRLIKVGATSSLLAGAATAVLGFFPLGAGAQALDVPWKPGTTTLLEMVARPVYFVPGESYPGFTSDPPVPAFQGFFPEDSETDREMRNSIFAQCESLDEVRCWTALDVFAGLPNGMLDWVSDALRPDLDRFEIVSLRYPASRSLLPRIFACQVGDASAHPFDDLMIQVLIREQKYFARFQDSGLATLAAEEGLEDIDTEIMMRGQQKIFLDAGRAMYFGRYGALFDARFRSEALDLSCWHPVDFVVAPTLVAGYAYMLGWEQKFNLMGLRCSFQFEPIRRILERSDGPDNDLVSAAGLEIGVGRFPVKAIISVGIMDGEPLIDFVGIGTSLGKARQVVARELSALRDDE